MSRTAKRVSSKADDSHCEPKVEGQLRVVVWFGCLSSSRAMMMNDNYGALASRPLQRTVGICWALRSVNRLEFWRRGANRSRYRVFGWWRGKAILLWLELIQHVVCQMVFVGLASSLANQMLTMMERKRWRRRRHTDVFSCGVCVFWDFLWCADETVKTVLHFKRRL